MTSALTTILIVAAIALCGVGIWAAIRLVGAADSVKRLSDDLESRLPPILDKAEVTVDAVNAELLRVDLIVTQVEEVTERVATASNAVHTIVSAPHEIANELGEKLRRGIQSARKHRELREHEKSLAKAQPDEAEDRAPAANELGPAIESPSGASQL